MSSTFADKSGRGLLLAALNKAAAEKGFSFAPSDLTFGAVAESTNELRESQVVYTATPDSGFEGEAIAFYNRLDLSDLFTNAGIEVVQVPAGATTVEEVVGRLNHRYGLGFTAEDIVFGETVAEDAGSIVLTAAEGSLGFKGQLTVELVVGKFPLAEVVVDPVLDDMNLNAELPAYLIDPVIVMGEITPKGRKPDGTMLNGSGNPVGQMTVAANGELELAVSARVWKSGELPVAQDGHYDVVIKDNGDWNFPFSIALLEEARPVTDLYDVTLKIQAVESGNELVFTLHRDEAGVFHFINEAHELDINDSATTPAGDVVQNIQRATFYKAQLGELTTNALGAPIGDFIISLYAARREGLVEAVQAEITVNVSVEAPV